MTLFYPLYCRRSDGKLEITAKGRRKEVNQPTDEQLDQKPDKNGVSDFYREVGVDEPKHLDWRRKLGGMLARELDFKDKTAQAGNEPSYMLVALPEHYRLYEHVKKVEKDGKTEIKSKTHAAGGHERQDAYLYGHPEGRRKRYRSPGDFFPHLLWLCTDTSGDHDNCPCKICSPDDPEDAESRPVGRPRSSKAEPNVKLESIAVASKVNIPPSSARAKQELSTTATLPRAQQPAALPPGPTPLPAPKTADQHLDLQYNTFIYRSGEVVWFQRGQAWGLGAILRRWSTQPDQFHYTVQPLSHPMEHPPAVVKSSHRELRPWLAWSVPKYTHDALNNMPNPPIYDTADWQGIKHGRYGPGDLEVDGSILAAKAVDSSFTLLGPQRTVKLDAAITESYYEGLFLGAEKIWVGDPIRIAPSTQDILVLHAIVEREQSVPGQLGQAQRSIFVVGDVYKLQHVQHPDPNIMTLAAPINNPQLPPRLTEDLTYRNHRSIAVRREASYWKLSAIKARIELNDIKGRWYEATRLLPVLERAAFDESARKGEIQEASLWMNARGNCLNSNRAPNLPQIPRQNIRKKSRRDAFSAALPAGAEIRDGVEVPLPDNVDPALAMASQESMEIDPNFDAVGGAEMNEGDKSHSEGHEVGGGLDDFMNLDSMEDGESQQFEWRQ